VYWQAVEESRRKKVVSTVETGRLLDSVAKDLRAEVVNNLNRLLEEGGEIG